MKRMASDALAVLGLSAGLYVLYLLVWLIGAALGE